MTRGPKVEQHATSADARLVAQAVARWGSQAAAARQTGVPQHRFSRASIAGQGRALSESYRQVIRDTLLGITSPLATLRQIMPTVTELRGATGALRWRAQHWWSITAGPQNLPVARFYLNGAGTDHELRFFARPGSGPPPADGYPCPVCSGVGRLIRDPTPASHGFLGPIPKETPDADGLLPCWACREFSLPPGRVPFFGACYSILLDPGGRLVAQFGSRIGGRGLSQPSKPEILWVARWCAQVVAGETE